MADPKEATQAKKVIVQGVSVEVSQPYSAGHPVTEAEAKALNQCWAENIGNNVRKAIKELVEAAGEVTETVAKAAQKLVTDKDKNYEFTLASVGGGARLDPLEKEARSLARSWISAQLKEMGITQKKYLTDNGEDAIDIKIAELCEHPEIKAAAEEALAARAKLAAKAPAIKVKL